MPLEPPELRREVARALRAVHDGAPRRAAARSHARRAAARRPRRTGERPAGPVTPERFAVLQALLAYLLARCGEGREATILRRTICRALPHPREELEEHLSLLNLVNFGGGCYTVYAELSDGEVHVDKELYGETFRAAPRLTPLEARAIRLALEYVGPMIAAEAHTPLDRVRKKLEETFGQFELVQTPEPHVGDEEESFVSTFSDGDPRAPARRDRVPEGRRGDVVDARRRAVLARARASELARAHVGPHARRRAQLPARPHAQREAARRDVRAARGLRAEPAARRAHRARPLHRRRSRAGRSSAARARSPTAAAVAELPVGSPEWLESEIFSYRGEAVVLEPEDLRGHIRDRAKELATELGVNRLRVTTCRQAGSSGEGRALAGHRPYVDACRRALRRSSAR